MDRTLYKANGERYKKRSGFAVTGLAKEVGRIGGLKKGKKGFAVTGSEYARQMGKKGGEKSAITRRLRNTI